MKIAYSQIVQVGLGSGAALAYEAVSSGLDLTAFDCALPDASTLINQKILHAGYFYKNKEDALALFQAFQFMHPYQKQNIRAKGARFIARQFQTLTDREQLWSAWSLPYQRLWMKDASTRGPLGKADGLGGFVTEDSIIDFPTLVQQLTTAAHQFGALILKERVTGLIIEGSKLVGLQYGQGVHKHRIGCECCIVAAGAWALDLLAQAGITLPVHRYKCHMLTLPGELVPSIMTWIDPPFLTVVPFKGSTIFADVERVDAADGDDLGPDGDLVESLKQSIHSAFPNMKASVLNNAQVRVGLKTEFCAPGERNYRFAIFGPEQHGISGLWVTFPGKASLMFALAREAVAAIKRTLDPLSYTYQAA
jgi:glycine/D-amino acid oxidase-like deaminating enzyme